MCANDLPRIVTEQYNIIYTVLGKALSIATVDVVIHFDHFNGLEVCPLNRADMQTLDFLCK